MIDCIAAIRDGLRMGQYPNEAAISQGIVLRVLSELSWPAYDTRVVWPEYALQGRRVDYALCHPPGKPIVFVEVKQVGQGVDAERQLFEYAFHQGVPLAILTTGQEWHFFLPAERGDYGERRVYKLDLLERGDDEVAARLRRYLDYRAVASGDAIEAARADYRSVAREREIRRTLPEAWRKLVEEGDELLLELLADKTESLCGFRPDPDAVADFLGGGVPSVPPKPVPRPPRVNPTPPPTTKPKAPTPPPLTGPGVELDGRVFPARSARDVLVRVFQELTARDPSFPERFAARTAQRRKRRYLARSREELFPEHDGLAAIPSHSRELSPGSGWWIDVNLSRRSIEQIVGIACEVAGLDLGTDLKVTLS